MVTVGDAGYTFERQGYSTTLETVHILGLADVFGFVGKYFSRNIRGVKDI